MELEIECIEDLASFIKETRIKYGLSQSQVAFVTKTERSLINRLENNKVDGIAFKTFLKLIKGLNGKLTLSA